MSETSGELPQKPKPPVFIIPALPNSQVIGYPKWSHLGPLIHAKELVDSVTHEQTAIR